MLLALSFYLVDSFVWSVAIGSLCFLLSGEHFIRMGYRKGILLLLVVIALLDSLGLPALLELDLWIKVGNREVLSLFGLPEEYFSAKELEPVRNFVFVSHTCILQQEIAYGKEARND